MKAIQLKKFGGPEEMFFGEVPTPTISDFEVLVKIKATALNRADLLQRRGLYSPPPGESEILGLEMAGEVVKAGSGVVEWKKGDRAFALLSGGGYAEYVSVHKDMLLPIPDHLEFKQAAGIAEAFLTAWQALIWLTDLKNGETILIHAGASGVGTAALQIAKNRGAKIVVTASLGKHDFCKKLGADQCIDYRTEDFSRIISQPPFKRADVLLDFIGAPYFEKNLQALKLDGRMVILGFMGGTKLDQIDLGPLLFKRLKIMGSTLRSRSLDYKIKLSKDFSKHFLPFIAKGQAHPVIDSVFDWSEVQKAHSHMAANKNKGKIILTVDDR